MTQEDKKEAIRMYECGCRYDDIAKKLNVSKSTVYNFFRYSSSMKGALSKKDFLRGNIESGKIKQAITKSDVENLKKKTYIGKRVKFFKKIHVGDYGDVKEGRKEKEGMVCGLYNRFFLCKMPGGWIEAIRWEDVLAAQDPERIIVME